MSIFFLFSVGSLTNSLSIPEFEESMKDCEHSNLNIDINRKFSVWVSFFEIYNECIYDLFVPVSSKFQKRKTLRLSQDVKGYSFIKGILMSIVSFFALKFLSRLCYKKADWKLKVFILFINSKIVRVVCALKICFGMFIKSEGKRV